MQTGQYTLKQKDVATKLFWLIGDWIGLPTALLGFITNLDNIKSALIAFLGMAYICVRIYYFVKEKEQSVRSKEYDLWNKEQDKVERIERHNAATIKR